MARDQAAARCRRGLRSGGTIARTGYFGFLGYLLDHPQQFSALLTRHLQLTGAAVLLATAIALPLGIAASRSRLLAAPLTFLALAVLALMLPLLGIGFQPALFALTIGAIMPIFLNTYIGIHHADRAIVDAARGMGASNLQRLLLVDLPLASPVIWAGIRTATVQTIAAASLAAFIGGGGLGDWVPLGLAAVNSPILLAGAVPIAILALVADIIMGRLHRFVTPAGLRVGAR